MDQHKRIAEDLSEPEQELLVSLYDEAQAMPAILKSGFSVRTLDALWRAELVTINSRDRYYLTSKGLNVRRFINL